MFELKEALDSDNPEEHISYMHVHMDGSCNGIVIFFI
jgi:DNA-directed RNA polymerase